MANGDAPLDISPNNRDFAQHIGEHFPLKTGNSGFSYKATIREFALMEVP
jgi:hypothetical protein